jgi:uncharacterized protein (DUF433 family)
MQTQILYPHIEARADGSAVIVPSGFKVRMLVQAYLTVGLNAAALHEMYPDLTMGQIHSALAYYWDHQAIVDAQIAAANAHSEDFMARNPSTLTRAKLEKRARL